MGFEHNRVLNGLSSELGIVSRSQDPAALYANQLNTPFQNLWRPFIEYFLPGRSEVHGEPVAPDRIRNRPLINLVLVSTAV